VSLRPQQRTAPLDCTAQVWWAPALIRGVTPSAGLIAMALAGGPAAHAADTIAAVIMAQAMIRRVHCPVVMVARPRSPQNRTNSTGVRPRPANAPDRKDVVS